MQIVVEFNKYGLEEALSFDVTLTNMRPNYKPRTGKDGSISGLVNNTLTVRILNGEGFLRPFPDECLFQKRPWTVGWTAKYPPEKEVVWHTDKENTRTFLPQLVIFFNLLLLTCFFQNIKLLYDIVALLNLSNPKKQLLFFDPACNVLTSAVVALSLGYEWIGCEANVHLPENAKKYFGLISFIHFF
jgi:hypothetical protein